MNWFAKVRRDFVAHYATKHGEISRGDIVEVFGVSLAQATADIAEAQAHYPSMVLNYDLTLKRYVCDWSTAALPVPAWAGLLASLEKKPT